MNPTDDFRARVLSGAPLVGTFLNAASNVTAEICARAGFDWLLVDLEHGSGGQADLLGQLQAISGAGAATIVRVELPARTSVSRALDQGADGVMLPRIEDTDEAARAIGYMRYPPDGVRGVAVQNRAGGFGRVSAAGLGELDDALVGVVQIETLGALRELDGIAAVDGVDVLFVGPGDLSYALGRPGRFEDDEYQDALRAVVAAATSAEVSAGILVPDLAAAERHLEMGFRFIAVGSDSAFVMRSAGDISAGFRSAAERLSS